MYFKVYRLLALTILAVVACGSPVRFPGGDYLDYGDTFSGPGEVGRTHQGHGEGRFLIHKFKKKHKFWLARRCRLLMSALLDSNNRQRSVEGRFFFPSGLNLYDTDVYLNNDHGPVRPLADERPTLADNPLRDCLGVFSGFGSNFANTPLGQLGDTGSGFLGNLGSLGSSGLTGLWNYLNRWFNLGNLGNIGNIGNLSNIFGGINRPGGGGGSGLGGGNRPVVRPTSRPDNRPVTTPSSGGTSTTSGGDEDYDYSEFTSNNSGASDTTVNNGGIRPVYEPRPQPRPVRFYDD